MSYFSDFYLYAEALDKYMLFSDEDLNRERKYYSEAERLKQVAKEKLETTDFEKAETKLDKYKHSMPVVHKTNKAVLVKWHGTEKEVWLPKSVIEFAYGNKGSLLFNAPKWLMEAKEEEAR